MSLRVRIRLLPALLAVSIAMLVGSVCLLADGLSSLAREPAVRLSDAAALDQASVPTRATLVRAVGAAILQENVFDSRTGLLPWQEPSSATVAGHVRTASAYEQGLAACDAGELRLVASIVNGSHPERSFAVLRRAGKTHLLPVGERVDDLTLLALFPTYAHLRLGEAVFPCMLPVYLPASQRNKREPLAARVYVSPVRARSPLFSAQELASSVRYVGGSRYVVSRRLLQRALGSPRAAMHGARLRPLARNGYIAGFELTQLRKESVLAHMGLQKGDVLRSINGYGLAGIEGLLQALRMLRKQDSVTLSVMRENIPQNFQYMLD